MDDKEFYRLLDKLSLLHGPAARWEEVKAQKSHVDEFGVEIKMWDLYYKRSSGRNVTSVFKMSRCSMEKHLKLVFQYSYGLDDLAEGLLAKKVKAEQEKEKEEERLRYTSEHLVAGLDAFD